jgi:hypothetical protein
MGIHLKFGIKSRVPESTGRFDIAPNRAEHGSCVRLQCFKQPLHGQLEDVDPPDDPSHRYGAASWLILREDGFPNRPLRMILAAERVSRK